MALKTYHGSCHCGAVRYEADLDLAQGTGKCNCSICTKLRNWSVGIKPDAFRLISGQDNLSDYQFASRQAHNVFCKTCGVHAFGYGNTPEIGGDYVAVRLASLDDATPEDLLSGPIRFANGRDNDWWREPEETWHL